MNLEMLDKFHKTRLGFAVFGLVELAMSYGFLNWGLDSGGWWLWVIALFLLVGSLQDFVHAIWRFKK
jgi:hypothetical protein